MDSTKALESICRTLAPYGHRDRDLERIAGEIVDDLCDEGFALTALSEQPAADKVLDEARRKHAEDTEKYGGMYAPERVTAFFVDEQPTPDHAGLVRRLKSMHEHLTHQPLTHADSVDMATIREAIAMVASEWKQTPCWLRWFGRPPYRRWVINAHIGGDFSFWQYSTGE